MAYETFLSGNLQLYPEAFALALFISFYSYQRRSLQLSGAVTACLIGYLTLGNPISCFGVALLSFFFVGNLATKYKHSTKASLVDEAITEPDQSSLGGAVIHQETNATPALIGRDWKQVLCNAWFGTACAVVYRIIQEPSIRSSLSNWEVDLLSRSLILAALAYWSACAGDTLASELGILSRSKPRLITTIREVPPGTNGAVSLWGLVCSAVGGLAVGAATIMISKNQQSTARVLVLCSCSGLLGSLLDSILGATVQRTLYSKTENRVVSNQQNKLGGKREIIIITGSNFLTNNQVNVVSSTLMGLMVGCLNYYLGAA